MGSNEVFPGFVRAFAEADIPFEGVHAWLVQGDRNQVVFAEFHETVDVAEHSHQEQWELVLAGSVNLRIGGEERRFEAGQHFFIPAGVPHSALVEAGYRAIIIFNEADRYQAK